MSFLCLSRSSAKVLIPLRNFWSFFKWYSTILYVLLFTAFSYPFFLTTTNCSMYSCHLIKWFVSIAMYEPWFLLTIFYYWIPTFIITDRFVRVSCLWNNEDSLSTAYFKIVDSILMFQMRIKDGEYQYVYKFTFITDYCGSRWIPLKESWSCTRFMYGILSHVPSHDCFLCVNRSRWRSLPPQNYYIFSFLLVVQWIQRNQLSWSRFFLLTPSPCCALTVHQSRHRFFYIHSTLAIISRERWARNFSVSNCYTLLFQSSSTDAFYLLAM